MEKKPMLYTQRTLNFDTPPNEELAHVAVLTSEPPPPANQVARVVPLVRPDRQLTYDALPHYEWPVADSLHDHDTITVDRIREDIDGPSHRFIIRRGDRVEAWFGKDDLREGLVVGISHAKSEVRVSFREGSAGQWFYKGQIYPIAPHGSDCSPSLRERRAKLSHLIDTVNSRYGSGLTTADAVPAHQEPPPVAINDRLMIIPVGFQERTTHPAENGTGAEGAVAIANDQQEVPPVVSKEEILAYLAEHSGQEFGMNELCQRFMPDRKLDGDSYRSHPVWKLFRDIGDANEATVVLTALSEPRFKALPPTTASYTFDEFRTFYSEHSQTPVAFERFQAEFTRIWDSQAALQTELVARFKAKPLAVLASRFGSWNAKRSTKEQNAASIVTKMLTYFVLDDTVSYSPFSGETYVDAVRKKVTSVSAGDYYRHFEAKAEEASSQAAALENPQSIADFHLFIDTRGEKGLTDEQLARFDALHADTTRERRLQQTPKHVEQFQSEELRDYRFIRKTGFHDRRGCPLHIVQLESRVERATFMELNRKAKMMGGYYSSFKKSDAGFQFLNEDQADRFCALLAGNVDRTDVLAARKERKELSAAERLHELATDLHQRAETTIEQSNSALQNTARRADQQAGIRGRAHADQALSRTLHSVAEALSRGEAKYLDGLRHKTHVETLDTVLYLAKWARIRALEKADGETPYHHGRRQDELREQPIGIETVRFAEYPYPYCDKRHLEDLITCAKHQRGAKQAGIKLRRLLSYKKDEHVTFCDEREISVLTDFCERLHVAGTNVERVQQSLEHYKRLQRANITDIHELRAALREYLEHRAERRGDDPVRVAERELIGKDLPGFFPTPRPIIERMLELAQIENQHRVLEPSCGKGDIIDVLKEELSEIQLHAIERNYSLSDVLAAKGHEVEFTDFLDHTGRYDRIVMNPPFENGQDIEHVQHAYSLLTPGGLLVSVMCEGPFFRSDVKSVAFRDWLEVVKGETEELPADAFQGKDAFRQTGVRTRLVVIIKNNCS